MCLLLAQECVGAQWRPLPYISIVQLLYLSFWTLFNVVELWNGPLYRASDNLAEDFHFVKAYERDREVYVEGNLPDLKR